MRIAWRPERSLHGRRLDFGKLPSVCLSLQRCNVHVRLSFNSLAGRLVAVKGRRKNSACVPFSAQGGESLGTGLLY